MQKVYNIIVTTHLYNTNPRNLQKGVFFQIL